MEKSLENIEKSLTSTSSGGGKAGNVLSGLAQSLGSLVASINSKKFDSKNANNIIDFTKSLAGITNTINPDGAKAFGEFAQGISNALDTIIGVMSPVKLAKLTLGVRMLFEGRNPIIKRIVTGMNEIFKDVDSSKAKEGSEAIKALGEGLLSLTKAMKSLIVIGIAAPLVAAGALVSRAVISLFVGLGKHAEEIQKGGDALKSLGKGLVIFSAGLASITLVTLIAGPMIVEAIGLIALFGLTFWALGKAGDSIEKGAKAVGWMGLAIVGFSGALAMMMLVLLIVKPAKILEGMLILAGFGLVFALIGKASKYISEGALTIIFGISLGLFFFSGALLILGAAMEMWTLEKAILATGLIAGIGAAIAFIGRLKGLETGVKNLMEMGIGLAALSGGILAFGLSIKLLDMIFKGDLTQAGIIAGSIILGLGGAISLVGTMKGLETGVASLTEMGIGLAAVAGGVLAFGISIKLLQMIFGDNLIEAGVIAGSILLGLGLAFAAIGAVGAFVAAGAGAMMSVGIALLAISGGILLFGLAIKGLQKIFGDDLTEAGKIAGGILLGLGLAFSAIGIVSPAIIFGAAAVLTMGAALLVFSGGLLLFGFAISKLNDKGLLEKKGDDYVFMGISVLTDIGSAVSKLGELAFDPFFWIGIAAAISLGGSLLVIGMGLYSAASALEKVTDMPKLIDSIFGDGGLIPSMAESFAKIGRTYGGRLLSSFLGTDDVSMGVRVTKGFGDVLQEIAGGIVAFADFTQFPVKVPDPKNPSKLIYRTVNIFSDIIPALNENLPILLSTLASTFTDIGAKYGGDGGWFGDDSPVQKGVDAVSGLGKVLSEIAGGIVAFSRFEEFPIQIPDPKDPSKLIYKSVNLWDSIPKIKEALVGDGNLQGKLTPKSGILFALAEVFAEIGDKFGDGFLSKGPVKKGVEAVKGIGGVVSELAQGIIAFANMQRGLPNYDKDGKFNGTYTPFTLEAVKNNIVSVLNTLPAVFAGIDVKAMEEARKKADAARPLAEAISDIGENLMKLQVDKGKGEKVNMVELIGPSLKKFVNDTQGMQIDEKLISQLKDLGSALQKFSNMGDGLKDFAVGLRDTGNAFNAFTKGFSSFSSQLEKFVKFENAFSNLVKNQSTYQFGKFAKDMGTLKDNVNAFNVENLKLTDSLMKSLSILSKASGEKLGEDIKEALEESMKQLVDAINKIAHTQESSSQGMLDMASTAFKGLMSPAPTPVVTPKPGETTSGKTPPGSQAETIEQLKLLIVAVNSLSSKIPVGSKGLRVEKGDPGNPW